MTDQVPSKEQIQPCPHGHAPGTCRACMRAEIERLQTALATANANHERFEREWYLRGDEIERLQTTLRGIQSCSTCEACRGAATLALDAQPAKEQRPHRGITSDWNYACTDNDCWCWASEHHNPREPKSDLVQQMRLAGYHDWASAVERLTRQVAELSIHADKWVKRALERAAPAASIRELVKSAYKDGYGADLTDDRDLSARTLELMQQLSRPAHEREGPHCSTCECGLVDVGRAEQFKAGYQAGAAAERLSHESARLKHIEQLMDAQPGTPEGAALDRLVDEQEKSEADWVGQHRAAKPPGDGQA